MKLLICTQAVDKNHPILGFFHRWIEEFAKHCEEVHVICLIKGEYSLPANVFVYSLGKEAGESRLKYLFRFYGLIWKLRSHYDHVFVHMNQVYVLLGSLLWRVWGKKIGLWYAHGKVSNSLRIAERMAHVLFTSTAQGLRLETPKRAIVGQGIDLVHFSFQKKEAQVDIVKLVTVGRISQSKNIETLISACQLLKEKGLLFIFNIVGTSYTPAEKEYEKEMRTKVEKLRLTDCIKWRDSISQEKLPLVLQESDIFIQDSTTQSLDKALLEAVACGCVVISSNSSYKSFSFELAPQYCFSSNNAIELCAILESVILLSSGSRELTMKGLRKALEEQHSIEGLISRIVKKFYT
jgi:glycosyltransferase involved in cell wall biosynthesis